MPSRPTGRPSRPAARRPARRVAAPQERVRRPRPKITGRMLVVLILAFVLAASFASSLEAYLRQKHNLDATEAQIERLKAEIAAKQVQVKLLQTNEHIEIWARQNGWAMPGEIAYRALKSDGTPMDTQNSLTPPSSVGVQQTPTAWWTNVLGSIDSAGSPKPPPAPTSMINRPDANP